MQLEPEFRKTVYEILDSKPLSNFNEKSILNR